MHLGLAKQVLPVPLHQNGDIVPVVAAGEGDVRVEWFFIRRAQFFGGVAHFCGESCQPFCLDVGVQYPRMPGVRECPNTLDGCVQRSLLPKKR